MIDMFIFFFFLELLNYDRIQKLNYGISYLILRMAVN